MDKIYLLLRNNKQSGPYTLQEIADLSLKPYDLIWKQGKAAAWQYPTELEELKQYVAAQPITTQSSAPTVQTPTPIVKSHDKPALRKKVFISLPIKSEESTPAVSQVVTQSSDDLSERQRKFEVKAEELRRRAVMPVQPPAEEPELDTKYARSLDDIKQEYSQWLNKRKRSGFPVRKAAWAVACLLVLTVGYFAWEYLRTDQQLPIASALPNEPTPGISTNMSRSVLKNEQGDTLVRPQYVVQEEEMVQPMSPFIEPLHAPLVVVREQGGKVEKPQSKADNYADNTMLSSPKGESAKQRQETVTHQGDETASDQTTEVKQESPSEQKTEPAKPASSPGKVSLVKLVDVSDRYEMDRKNRISNFFIKVTNGSQEHLSTVAVNVFFILPDGSSERKTYYFDDIRAGGLSEKNIPVARNVTGIKYQLGLITSESGMVYARHSD